MSYFDELDLMIQETALYDPETGKNETTYLQLRDEVNEHIQGRLAYDQLSTVARDLIIEWEALCESYAAQAESYENETHEERC